MQEHNVEMLTSQMMLHMTSLLLFLRRKDFCAELFFPSLTPVCPKLKASYNAGPLDNTYSLSFQPQLHKSQTLM